MELNWSDYSSSVTSREFNSTCEISEYITGDRFCNNASQEVLKLTTVCRIVANTDDNSEFAQSAQYKLSIPYTEETPTIYVGDRVKIETPNEIILCEVDKTMPVSALNKMLMYVKRTTWNLKPSSDE